MATLADVEKTLDRIARSMEESDRRSDKRREEMERVLAESRAEAERALAASRTETERMLADYRAETERMRTEAERMRAETQQEMRRMTDRIGNEIAYLTETLIIPNIKVQMGDFGHNFTNLGVRYAFYRPDKKKLAEVDVLLRSGDEVMVVEVMTSLTADRVQPCVEKLKKLRENETITHLEGKKLYAAIAGLNVADDARKLALSLGMYVIEMYEDKSYIKVTKPENEVAVW